MDYVKGIFKNRPNRFIAEVEVDGKIEIAHLPNTGRCKELLVDGAAVYLKPSDNPKRKQVDDSRIDIYLANLEDDCCGMEFLVDSCYIEVKGVTLIVDGEARFPDAPTERGAKHLKELIKLKNDGNRAVVFFLIQHPAGNDFRPNWENDPKFSQTLVEAENAGVEILVYKCNNTLEGIELVPKSLDYDLNALKNK